MLSSKWKLISIQTPGLKSLSYEFFFKRNGAWLSVACGLTVSASLSKTHPVHGHICPNKYICKDYVILRHFCVVDQESQWAEQTVCINDF